MKPLCGWCGDVECVPAKCEAERGEAERWRERDRESAELLATLKVRVPKRRPDEDERELWGDR
jgi:hypothetical protein